ncbi:hypothetical protein B0T19DRAFT_109890, partial [Cercophora scortea]
HPFSSSTSTPSLYIILSTPTPFPPTALLPLVTTTPSTLPSTFSSSPIGSEDPPPSRPFNPPFSTNTGPSKVFAFISASLPVFSPSCRLSFSFFFPLRHWNTITPRKINKTMASPKSIQAASRPPDPAAYSAAQRDSAPFPLPSPLPTSVGVAQAGGRGGFVVGWVVPCRRKPERERKVGEFSILGVFVVGRWKMTWCLGHGNDESVFGFICEVFNLSF